MILIINSFLILFLLLISIQDFKHREISWVLIPLTFLALLVNGVNTISKESLIQNSLMNLSFVFIQLAVLTIYMSIKNKKIVNILQQYIGLGDLLFFVVLCLAFSPVNFIVFYISSMTATLIGFAIYFSLSVQKESKEIPLAGAMASILVITILINSLITHLNFYDDYYFINIING